MSSKNRTPRAHPQNIVACVPWSWDLWQRQEVLKTRPVWCSNHTLASTTADQGGINSRPPCLWPCAGSGQRGRHRGRRAGPVSNSNSMWHQVATVLHGPPHVRLPRLVAFGLNKSQVLRFCKGWGGGGGGFRTDVLLEGSRRKPKSDVTEFVLQEIEKEAHPNLGSSCVGRGPNHHFSFPYLATGSALTCLPLHPGLGVCQDTLGSKTETPNSNRLQQ